MRKSTQLSASDSLFCHTTTQCQSSGLPPVRSCVAVLTVTACNSGSILCVLYTNNCVLYTNNTSHVSLVRYSTFVSAVAVFDLWKSRPAGPGMRVRLGYKPHPIIHGAIPITQFLLFVGAIQLARTLSKLIRPLWQTIRVRQASKTLPWGSPKQDQGSPGQKQNCWLWTGG